MNKRIFIIAGPTAAGKTSFAILLAKALNTEIISADSRQCFKELSIGVARPSEAELAAVPHYFIASHSVAEELNAGYFEQYALEKTAALFANHDSVVMVGGTGLYIKAFCEGIDPMPVIPPEVRAGIIEQYESKGLIWLQSELKHKDPAFWAVAEQQNPQRLMRALEVFNATGKSITVFRSAQKKQRNFEIIKIGLELPMDLLTQRINLRVDQMMKDGLPDEARSVISFRNKSALQTVGYREMFDYIDGKIALEEAVQQIKLHTRQYAKRQMTWFKKDPAFTWYDARTVSVEAILVP
ncbi:MAG TPA: tRNA (adenosine(37)-N6)-dimethylallyltransferase MiaA [Sediminibacterium sp.]|nr:tRNA (adenosine(37)-N6)-dimethylallyltransferase MiaA [Sediminibacterium sp.]